MCARGFGFRSRERKRPSLAKEEVTAICSDESSQAEADERQRTALDKLSALVIGD